ncbi:zinc finger BED domain-containing protein 4 [Biomphalaria pfeifferi]|uniref:Zinc finger BED domain-containing protein 4 n=1 Tax=Biomphalaria pfeifferi TaxID=112525 RepID=A0AAD8BRH3_BIOPF|nr:zinc finger BED domain-containing protein 4 [Biomphalaria pfeifferi]
MAESKQIENSFERSVFTEFFTKIEIDNKNVRVRCKLCPPAYSCALNSTANLKKHLQSVHPAAHDKLPTLKRSVTSSNGLPEPVAKKQKTLTSWTSNSVALLSQQHVNDLIMNFVIGDMQAFSVC